MTGDINNLCILTWSWQYFN